MSNSEELLENLSNYFLDNFEMTKVNSTFVYLEDGTKYGRKQFLDENTRVADMDKANCLAIADWKRSEQDLFFKKTLDNIAQHLRYKAFDKFSDSDIPEVTINRMDLVPVLNLKDDTVVMFNKKTKAVSEVCFKAWERKLSKDERGVVGQTMRDALLVYDPYDLTTFTPMEWESMQVLKVNTYDAPPWRKLPPRNVEEMPPLIEKFLVHLFPDEKSLDYVLHWMYTAMVKRNETYLVLNGKKGAGKGIFVALLAAIVGRNHYTEAPHSLLNSQFNAALDQKRLLVFDEFKVGKPEHSRLKRYINKIQSIEKKGIDADKPSETYNNYVISNNDLSDMYLEWDDRRFSVPDLAEDQLNKSLASKDIEILARQLEDDTSEMVIEFGNWLYRYGPHPEMDEFTVLKSERYWKLVYASLSEWQKFTVDTILGKESDGYFIKDIARAFTKDNAGGFSRFPRNYQKVADLLNNYRHKGRFELGEVEKIEGEWWIIPSKRFAGDTEDQESIL